jgi:hypothetical protein
MSNEKWEIVFGGQVTNGVLVGGDVRGNSFESRDAAEAEAANMRRAPEQVIRVRRIGDNMEKYFARRVAAMTPEDALSLAMQPVVTMPTPPTPSRK